MSGAEPARPVLAAIAVIIEQGRVLLVRRRNPPVTDLWGFPGGKVELGETVFAAAERELAEETGVAGEARDLLTFVDVIGADASYHYVLAAVHCARLSGEPVAASDAREAAWHPLADVLERRLPINPRVDEVARLALARVAG